MTQLIKQLYNYKYCLLLVLILLISTNTFAQRTKLTKKADDAFLSYEYFNAIELYKEAYSKETSKPEKAYQTFQIAQCYRFINETAKAEAKYASAIAKKYEDPIAYLYYADMLKTNEKYKEAVDQYKAYLALVPGDTLAEMGVISCSLSAKWYENPTRYEIANVKELNTKQSDYAPAFAKEDYSVLYFTSTRKGFHPEKINKVTGQNFTDLFESNYSKKEYWEEPKPLNDTINSPFDEGTPSLTKDGTTMFFVRCRIVRGEQIGCQIYTATRPAGGEWTTTEVVPISADSVSVGQPSISDDECTLYFVANSMKKGIGQRDIWKIEREKTSKPWGDPINLGPQINTTGNEMYPYIREDGTLYFASDGHPGMGGIDIFRAKQDSAGNWTVENMKYPINSSADDFGIIFKGMTEEGYFTSSRKQTTNLFTEEGAPITIRGRGSDDIYSFVLPPMEFSLRGFVYDDDTGDPVFEADVQLVGSDGTMIKAKTNDKGRFKFKLAENNDYLYIVTKEGYLKGKGKLTTNNMEDSKKFRPDVRLAKIGKPIEIDNIFYEFGKWDLTEDSKLALKELVDILNNNGNITIELAAHTDSVGIPQANDALSQKRAESVVKFLIESGIAKDRLTAKGYGESVPKTISKRVAEQYPYLNEGDVLTPKFIKSVKDAALAKASAEVEVDEDEVQKMVDMMNQLNRRTEFTVTSTKYIPF